ncbi:uncharacterized protein LOC131651161 [Vicia villosa]|uniref:uncharacterized protein LOC131651161 n=1 Tax=Vicia villosa TaxID=3911 RepID=UPI00273BE321|nr:uncharacterized protein LOC131651161 [Vicia villosa]
MVRDWWIGDAWSIKDSILQALPTLLPLIAGVSIPDAEVDDCFVGKNAKDGQLTLKEAYNSIAKPRPCVNLRSFPWDIDTPPAHSMIVWRFIHNKLPTDENLRIKGFSFPSLCSLCNTCSESSPHLFFECSFVRKIWNWFAGTLKDNRLIYNLEDCRKIMEQPWCPRAKVVVQASIACIFHQIWTTRNKNRFEDKTASWKTRVGLVNAHAKIVGDNSRRGSNSAMTNFVFHKKFGVQIHPKKPVVAKEVLWSPPLAGWLKCNIDEVVSGNHKLAACGVLCRDHQANHIFSLCDFIGSEAPEVAELMAVILAIEEAKRRNITNLWLETDCIFVVNAFKNRSMVSWKLRSRWLVCWDYSIRINFMVTHI